VVAPCVAGDCEKRGGDVSSRAVSGGGAPIDAEIAGLRASGSLALVRYDGFLMADFEILLGGSLVRFTRGQPFDTTGLGLLLGAVDVADFFADDALLDLLAPSVFAGVADDLRRLSMDWARATTAGECAVSFFPAGKRSTWAGPTTCLNHE
jgi:hypothetical protein